MPTEGRRRGAARLPLVAAALLVLALCAGLVTRLAQDRSASGDGALARLSLRGTTLVADGQRVVLHPVTHYLLPFYDDGHGGQDRALATTSQRAFATRDATFRRMRAMGFDAVRVPLSSALFDGAHDVYGLGPGGALDRVRAIVASAEAAHLRVVLCWWDSLQQGAAFAEGFRAVLPSMRAVHAAVSSDTGVVFEPWNEPHDLAPGAWERTSAATVSFFRQELGYRGVLLLDTDAWSYGVDALAAGAVQRHDAALLGSPAQVVFATHRYARANTCFCGAELASWQQAVGRHLADLPVAGTEYGYTDGSGPPQPAWNSQLLDHLDTVGVPAGLNAVGSFVWDWVDANTLTVAGGPLTEHGQIVEEHLRARASS